MTDVINGDVVGIPEGEVEYPLLGSLWAGTKKGKTWFGASMPNAVLIDFPPAKLSFGKVEIDQIALKRTVGEGFEVCLVQFGKQMVRLFGDQKLRDLTTRTSITL